MNRELRPLPPFKGWVLENFPFIEADFDAITNYQLISKVIEYLNNIISNENEQNEAIIDLTNKFIELKNYIDNLDLQEYVDNKLDDMAESGELDQIIEQYLSSSAVWGFDTVAEMKDATNLINGSYAKTLGYHSKNDEGGATYKIREITNDDVVDEAFIIELSNNNLVAELILKDNITAEMCGAYGDNTHDDILAIQKCINYVKEHNYYKIIMNKSYLISDTIDIEIDNANIEINGTINYTGVTYAVRYNGSHSRLYIDSLISNYDGVLIEGNSTSNTAYNEFNFNYMLCNHNGITEYANHGWLQYNEFKFKNIRANNIGINLISINEPATSWITETKYWCGMISAKEYGSKNEYCLYVNSPTVSAISTQKFYNLGFEGTKVGAYLNNVQGFIFENCRHRESIQNLVFKLVGKCNRNTFNVEQLPIKWIDYSELIDFSSANIFTGSFMADGGGVMEFTSFSLDHQGMKYCNQKSYLYNNAGSNNRVYTLNPSSYTGFITEILMGSGQIGFDTKYYNWQNINQVFIVTGAISDDNKYIIDQNGNTLIDLTGKGYKKLRVTFMQQQISSWNTGGILIEEITPLT